MIDNFNRRSANKVCFYSISIVNLLQKAFSRYMSIILIFIKEVAIALIAKLDIATTVGE